MINSLVFHVIPVLTSFCCIDNIQMALYRYIITGSTYKNIVLLCCYACFPDFKIRYVVAMTTRKECLLCSNSGQFFCMHFFSEKYERLKPGTTFVHHPSQYLGKKHRIYLIKCIQRHIYISTIIFFNVFYALHSKLQYHS